MEKILVMNPGSTSTKIAVYQDETPLFVESIEHSQDELKKFENIIDQYEMRKDLILATMEKNGVKKEDLTAIVSRGGLLPPIEAGAYEVNEDMVWQLTNAPQNEHASNLGGVIANAISKELDIPAYIYDAVTVDELEPLAKVTGLPEMQRKGMGHNLNMRAAAMKYSREQGRPYSDISVIVAHLGGGITLSLHHQGRIVDMISDDEGPFSPERAGGLPAFQVIDMATRENMGKKAMMKKVKSQGGLMGYFGVNDTRIVEKMMMDGDEKAKLIYDAMILNVARNIAKLSVYVDGKIDNIILTGGIAYSEYFTKEVAKRVEFIAPMIVYAGENEMESLALGALRVQRGEEKAKTFVKVIPQ